MSELQTKFEQLIAEQRDLSKKFQETAQGLFKETTKDFFEKNSGIKAIVWTQYTPFFNDGDTCEFSVNEPVFTNAEREDLEYVNPWGEYEGENEKIWVCETYSIVHLYDDGRPWLDDTREAIKESGQTIDIKACDLFSRMIQSADFEPVMEAMFGNHVKVIATKDGFDVEEYDHD